MGRWPQPSRRHRRSEPIGLLARSRWNHLAWRPVCSGMYDYPALVSALHELPARFHLDLLPVAGSVTLADLSSRPALVRGLLEVEAKRVGAPSDQVAASMLIQRTAMILGGATLASVFVGGALPIAGSDAVFIAEAEPKPMSSWRFALSSPDFVSDDRHRLIELWAEHWIDGILGGLAESVRSVVRVGGRLLRDNLASAAASGLVFFSHWYREGDFAGLASTLEAAGTPRLGESVSLGPIEHRGHVGLRATRRSCCLHSRTQPPHSCPGCPDLESEEQVRIMRHHLEHLEAVRDGGAPPRTPVAN